MTFFPEESADIFLDFLAMPEISPLRSLGRRRREDTNLKATKAIESFQ